MMRRREFLKTVAGGGLALLLPGCSDRLADLFGPERERLWGMNVHPYTGALADLQIRALRELGIQRIRITLGLEQDMASRYMRAYPAEYLGLISDFDLIGVTPRAWPDMVRTVVSRHPGVSWFQVLNEPDVFLRTTPQVYVGDYLAPAFDIIRELRPGAKVVAAAPRGTQDGVLWFNQMSDAGADRWCDYRAAHLYHNNPEQYMLLTDKPFLVSETGASNPAEHLSWWRNTMPHIAKVLKTDRLFWYALVNSPADGYDLIREQPGPGGAPVPTSPLYAHIRDTY